MQPLEHLVELDSLRAGPALMINRLAGQAQGEWLLPFADDDLLDADFLETLSSHLDGADVVYPWCRVDGSPWSPNRFYRPGVLRYGNFITATALIRKTLWDDLGGYRPEQEFEDWDFWLRAEKSGATFRCVPEVLWTYRMHGGNLFNDLADVA